jgi:hypothetical protein
MSNELVNVENTTSIDNTAAVELNIPNGYICTVDRTTREGTIKIANALSDAASLAEIGDKHFNLVDVITTPGVRNRTGEICTNTYLIDSDGNIYMTQSDGLKRSAQQIVGLFNGDFGEDGIEVAVIEKKLNNGNTLKTLHFYA